MGLDQSIRQVSALGSCNESAPPRHGSPKTKFSSLLPKFDISVNTWV